MEDSLHGDLKARATASTESMEWAPSPSGTVWRKRVHRVGPPESGQVTSVVRYEPESKFPPHEHPEGEEILVLDGVFSDEHGDWAAGTYLLNPEGFRHAPFSKPGCVLFVKLRQFPGLDREHVVIQTRDMDWTESETPGVTRKPLYAQAGFSDRMYLEHWQPGAERGSVAYEQGVEIFVLDGSVRDDEGRYAAGHWLRLPAGASQTLRSEEGGTLYVKTGGLPYLRSGTCQS